MATIGIIGASGFVGSRLRELAIAAGHRVIRFSRSDREGYRVMPPSGLLDFSGIDAVVNLAGEPILGLWTKEKKRRIVESRTAGTRRVVESLLAAPATGILVNASAVGFYGDTGDTVVDESSHAGEGFLASTCTAWEAATAPAETAGRRVVRIRIGFVLGRGGAMKLVLPVFRLGLGGNLGSGRQWMSCVHVDDVAGLILWAIENGDVSGPLNAVMPEPVANADFTKAVGRAVQRPTIFPAPAPLLRLFLGGVSSVMLDSVRVVPKVAVAGGYSYRFVDVPSALQSLVTPK